MKKTILFLLIIIGTLQVAAEIKNKQVVGKWKYKVETGADVMTGVFRFIENDGTLKGEVVTDDGYTLPFSKIEKKDANGLHLEVKTEYDLIQIDIKIEGDKFTGTGSTYEGEAPITGERIKE
jgi:hypothetical protein